MGTPVVVPSRRTASCHRPRHKLRQIEHVEPHTVDALQSNKLVFVAHVRQLLLEAGNGLISSKFLCQLKDSEQL